MADIKNAKRLVLADWKKQRDELNSVIAALERELGEEPSSKEKENTVGTGSPMSTAPIRVEDIVQPGDFFGMTQVAASKEFLSRLNKRTATLNEIAAALYRGKSVNSPIPESGLKNLSSLLSRSTEFLSVARGRWGLAANYPGKVRKGRKGSAED